MYNCTALTLVRRGGYASCMTVMIACFIPWRRHTPRLVALLPVRCDGLKDRNS